MPKTTCVACVIARNIAEPCAIASFLGCCLCFVGVASSRASCLSRPIILPSYIGDLVSSEGRLRCHFWFFGTRTSFRRRLVGDAGLSNLVVRAPLCLYYRSPHALDITLPPNSRARLSAVRMHLSTSIAAAPFSLRFFPQSLPNVLWFGSCWLRLGACSTQPRAQNPPPPEPADSPYIFEGVSDIRSFMQSVTPWRLTAP